MSFKTLGQLMAQTIAAMKAMGVDPEADIVIIVRNDKTDDQLVASSGAASAEEQIALLQRATKTLQENPEYQGFEVVDRASGQIVKKGES